MRIATNIFNSPENTGPGNFGRRLAVALEPLGVQLVPVFTAPDAQVFLGSAFLDGATSKQKKVLRVDGLGAGRDIPCVEAAHKQADFVIYQSEFSKKLLQKAHDHAPEHSTVIYNGVEIPEDYHIFCTHKINLLSICNTWNKYRYPKFLDIVFNNFDYLLERLKRFDVTWTIVGKYEEFKAAMGDEYLKFQDHIKFVPFTPDLDKLRREADIFIHLVEDDSCPNSVIEAMSYGLPCIVWHKSAGPELLGGYTGCTIRRECRTSIYDCIEELKENWSRHAWAARYQAEKRFDINVVAQQYKEVFENVLS